MDTLFQRGVDGIQVVEALLILACLCRQQLCCQTAQFIRVLYGVQDVICHAAMMTDEDRNILITG
uniref:hypothetical protein n=1 Tax=Escherichia marmotae TaxID=1499973 RepID=UPI0036F474AC